MSKKIFSQQGHLTTKKQIHSFQDQQFHCVCVKNIDKFLDPSGCIKLINKYFPKQPPFLPTHLLKYPQKSFFFLNFRTPQQKNEFMEYKVQKKNRKIKIKEAYIRLQQLKKFQQINQIKKIHKQIKIDQKEIEAIKQKDIRDIVTPLWKYQYKDQVEIKIKELNKVIQKINSKTKQINFLTQFYTAQLIHSYRNKMQFTIGYNQQNQIQIGFNKGSIQKKSNIISDPKDITIIQKQALQIVNKFRNFLRKLQLQMNLKPYDRYNHNSGIWRYFIIRRSDRTNKTLCTLVLTKQFVQNYEEIEQKLKIFFKQIQYVTSFNILDARNLGDYIPINKPQPIFGEGHYQEIILGNKFNVSSSAFLQTNIQMCQKIYKTIIQQIDIQKGLVLDLYSGIGTIGICLSHQKKQLQVIGIEMNQSACQDAKLNIQTNPCNYKVILGNVQDHIKNICQKQSDINKQIMAIVDPSRSGLHKSVLKALRTCKGLNKILYIACNPTGIINNLEDLICEQNKKRKGPRFIIQKIFGYDMFPQTMHIEALFVLQRLI